MSHHKAIKPSRVLMDMAANEPDAQDTSDDVLYWQFGDPEPGDEYQREAIAEHIGRPIPGNY